MESLQEGLRLLASRTDEDTSLGHLQAQLISIKGSFHTFLTRHNTMRVALQRSQACCTALELVLDQRAGEVLAVREDNRVAQLALHRLVDELRARLSVAEGASMPMATICTS